MWTKTGKEGLPVKPLSQIKQEAKEHMKGRYGDIFNAFWPAIIISLLNFGISFREGFATGQNVAQTGGITLHSYINTGTNGSFLVSILAMVAMFTTATLVRRMYMKREYGVDFLQAINGQTVGIALSICLFNALLGAAFGFAVALIILTFSAMVFATGSGLSAIFLWVAIFAAAIGFIWLLLPLGITPFIAADFDEGDGAPSDYSSQGIWAKAVDVFKASYTMMKGNRMDLFLFYLSFIGWYLLMSVTFGLAAFYVEPYTTLATYGWYRNRLRGDA